VAMREFFGAGRDVWDGFEIISTMFYDFVLFTDLFPTLFIFFC